MRLCFRPSSSALFFSWLKNDMFHDGYELVPA